MLPILHLNGYKISNPTAWPSSPSRIWRSSSGAAGGSRCSSRDAPAAIHESMARTLDTAVERIRAIRADARQGSQRSRPRWPMIVLRSPKGDTGPKVVDGRQVEGTFRSHQVPLLLDADHSEHLAQVKAWMRSYKPEDLFDDDGRLLADLAPLAPPGERRTGTDPHTNGAGCWAEPSSSPPCTCGSAVIPRWR